MIRKANSPINLIIVVGEIVDTGVIQIANKIYFRARLKIRPNSVSTKFVYIDVIGENVQADVMSLICSNGNIVYVEGEFRNNHITKDVASVFIRVRRIECLLRRRDVKVPDSNIVKLLDDLDPIGYLKEVKVKPNARRRKNKETKRTPKAKVEV